MKSDLCGVGMVTTLTPLEHNGSHDTPTGPSRPRGHCTYVVWLNFSGTKWYKCWQLRDPLSIVKIGGPEQEGLE